MNNPKSDAEWLEAWLDGGVSTHDAGLYVSKVLGELLEDKVRIDYLKSFARQVAAKDKDAIPGFEIGNPSSYEQPSADYKALMELKDTIESVDERLWQLIEQRVIKVKTISKVAPVQFVGSQKAQKAEVKRKDRNTKRLEEELALEKIDDLL